MAKSKKHKTSIFLCCFRSSVAHESTKKGSDPIAKEKEMMMKKKGSWFSWRRIRFNKNSSHKTVPLEAPISDHAHYSKSRSKSTLQNKPQVPATNPPQPSPVLPATPYYTPTQTRHGASASIVEDTRQQGRGSPAQATKRQGRRVSSSSSASQSQTTSKKAKSARRSSYDPVVGMSVLVVTLVIVIFWGRLCAILCTSLWLYCTPRFRKVNDTNDPHTTKPNDVVVDLDSEEYKKKVIMEGLLERNHIHRATL
ncbi:hypothetical protein Fmac_007339 [Flemingia macrophylla]|uniref:Uncharacterized protein n=1 Tax=Flemingia macrophylla TaxID=520843 RepID=A0ABD1MUD0_9FABA